ncbi:rab3 GTPase-activating protein catalytic subunit-like [Simochromis diagramma]|uniref:rab3 GTPase-activating protein catalytic subunit-like n=1 Tax=Simochromis diagramma TaxID=43689 RepID=UPI001A7E4B74|nr:rab3 GTPase-activating protein catalytic subunit-like [Simochromis diagramma]
MVHSARKHIRRHRRIDELPLNTEILNSVLLYLFPDAAVEKSDCKNNTQLSNSSGTSEQEKTSDYNLFHQLKSALSDSLTYRLALCVCVWSTITTVGCGLLDTSGRSLSLSCVTGVKITILFVGGQPTPAVSWRILCAGIHLGIT